MYQVLIAMIALWTTFGSLLYADEAAINFAEYEQKVSHYHCDKTFTINRIAVSLYDKYHKDHADQLYVYSRSESNDEAVRFMKSMLFVYLSRKGIYHDLFLNDYSQGIIKNYQLAFLDHAELMQFAKTYVKSYSEIKAIPEQVQTNMLYIVLIIRDAGDKDSLATLDEITALNIRGINNDLVQEARNAVRKRIDQYRDAKLLELNLRKRQLLLQCELKLYTSRAHVDSGLHYKYAADAFNSGMKLDTEFLKDIAETGTKKQRWFAIGFLAVQCEPSGVELLKVLAEEESKYLTPNRPLYDEVTPATHALKHYNPIWNVLDY